MKAWKSLNDLETEQRRILEPYDIPDNVREQDRLLLHTAAAMGGIDILKNKLKEVV